MLDPGEPKFRRRKADRPGEIVEAAMAVFAERGFAARELDEIARRAGVSKGALYLYFETKEEHLPGRRGPGHRAEHAGRPRHGRSPPGAARPTCCGWSPSGSATLMETLPVGGVVKMVIGEAGNFPALARVWHDDLVAHILGALTDAIARRPGAAARSAPATRASTPWRSSPPCSSALIWRETFVPVGARALRPAAPSPASTSRR